MRHGQSTANVEGIIASDYELGTTIWGLTDVGTQQAKDAGRDLHEMIGKQDLLLNDKVLFATSPFTRARETALEAQKALGALVDADNELGLEYLKTENLVVFPELRERSFGELDQRLLIWYNKVWPIDAIDSTNKRNGVESVYEVCLRLLNLVKYIESTYENKIIVLSSHADTLQIFQMIMSEQQEDPRLFSQYRFKNGESRNLVTDLPTERAPLEYK